MTTDDFGSVVYPGSIDNGAIDTEHSPILYPPKSDRICAADERFASVNEAIGLLEYKLEQHITQCADGLAPLADFISASWAVIDELVTRIEQLEAAQPIPQIQRLPDGDALTAAYMVGLEDGRRPHDGQGGNASHDAYDELEAAGRHRAQRAVGGNGFDASWLHADGRGIRLQTASRRRKNGGCDAHPCGFAWQLVSRQRTEGGRRMIRYLVIVPAVLAAAFFAMYIWALTQPNIFANWQEAYN
jgi:hypothetical protein